MESLQIEPPSEISEVPPPNFARIWLHPCFSLFCFYYQFQGWIQKFPKGGCKQFTKMRCQVPCFCKNKGPSSAPEFQTAESKTQKTLQFYVKLCINLTNLATVLNASVRFGTEIMLQEQLLQEQLLQEHICSWSMNNLGYAQCSRSI